MKRITDNLIRYEVDRLWVALNEPSITSGQIRGKIEWGAYYNSPSNDRLIKALSSTYSIDITDPKRKSFTAVRKEPLGENMNKKQLKEDKQSKEKFLKDLAQEGWDSGHPFDPDDFIEFKQICKESGHNVTKVDFDRYFEIFDDIRYDYYHQDEEDEEEDIVFDESLKESVKIADIEVKDEDYIFDEDTGNIHLTDEVVNYHPKYKNYINVKFVDDEDEKVYTYKLVEYNPKETNYPYEFEYISEAEDFTDMEESLKEDKDDANMLVDTIDTELRYYGFYDPYYIKECKGDIEIMWDDYCNDNEDVNKEDTEIKIIFKELMQPHISNIQK